MYVDISGNKPLSFLPMLAEYFSLKTRNGCLLSKAVFCMTRKCQNPLQVILNNKVQHQTTVQCSAKGGQSLNLMFIPSL